MNKSRSIKNITIYVVFFCYILFLIKILFIARVSASGVFSGVSAYSRITNIIPFNTIKEQIFTEGGTVSRYLSSNIIGNILLFIPLGTYLVMLRSNKKVLNNVLIIITASMFVEIIQWILDLGYADIDDVILNLLGGLLGILFYKVLLFVHKDKNEVCTIISRISVIVLPVLIYMIFIVRLQL